jgi:hypothetical protein
VAERVRAWGPWRPALRRPRLRRDRVSLACREVLVTAGPTGETRQPRTRGADEVAIADRGSGPAQGRHAAGRRGAQRIGRRHPCRVGRWDPRGAPRDGLAALKSPRTATIRRVEGGIPSACGQDAGQGGARLPLVGGPGQRSPAPRPAAPEHAGNVAAMWTHDGRDTGVLGPTSGSMAPGGYALRLARRLRRTRGDPVASAR